MQCSDVFQNSELFNENNLTHFLYKQNITSIAVQTQVNSFPREITEQQGFYLMAGPITNTEVEHESLRPNLLLLTSFSFMCRHQ